YLMRHALAATRRTPDAAVARTPDCAATPHGRVGGTRGSVGRGGGRALGALRNGGLLRDGRGPRCVVFVRVWNGKQDNARLRRARSVRGGTGALLRDRDAGHRAGELADPSGGGSDRWSLPPHRSERPTGQRCGLPRQAVPGVLRLYALPGRV